MFFSGNFHTHRIHVWYIYIRTLTIKINQMYRYLDLPRGAEWMIRGAYTPSLRVQTAPFGRCWYKIIPYMDLMG